MNQRKSMCVLSTFVLCLMMMAFAVAGASASQVTDASGQWKYVLKEGGATITGYAKPLPSDLFIPNELDGHPVMSIRDRAFEDLNHINNVTIPDSVTSIGDSAFLRCSRLTSVTIPDSVTSIGMGAFYRCYSLTNITIPSGVTCIEPMTFYSCASLADVIIPASVTRIGEDAFKYCPNLTLTVMKGSFAEQYAKDNDIPYFFTSDSSWLDN